MQVGGCHICGGTHEPGQCAVQQDPSREVNYIGILNRHGFQGYHQEGPLGFNHDPPGFNQRRTFTQGSSWKSQGNQYNKEHKNQPPYQHPSQGPSHQDKPTNIKELLIQFKQETRSHQKSIDVVIQNLEVQISQLAQEKAERTTRTFGCNTEKNPKEESKAVLTRSQKRAQEEGEVEEDQSEEGRTNRDEEKEEEGEKKEEEDKNEWNRESRIRNHQNPRRFPQIHLLLIKLL